MSDSIEQLSSALRRNQPVLVLTGAGISTGSGIPAYRNSKGEWTHPRPVMAADFKAHDGVRRRYWRRSMHGWPGFHSATPNAAHKSLAALQSAGIVSGVVTQNVDGLHLTAGSEHVIELHGALRTVVCLQCDRQTCRAELQTKLLDLNPEFIKEDFRSGADGDARPVDETRSDMGFQYVNCDACGGLLKPAVVFYGESVPAAIVHAVKTALSSANSLLCIGSSLSVLSGFRFCREAQSQHKPVFILNQGKTRADEMAALKLDMDCAEALTILRGKLCK